MKKLLLLILVIILGFPMLAQEVHFPSMVLAGGGGTSEGNTANISRWRLSQVHIITLPEEETIENDLTQKGIITIYPNPAKDFLYIKFQTEESGDYILRLTDVLGRTLLIQDQRTILPEQIIELNVTNYIPATYILHVESPDQKTRGVFPVQKI
jgi:hypothetical protein